MIIILIVGVVIWLFCTGLWFEDYIKNSKYITLSLVMFVISVTSFAGHIYDKKLYSAYVVTTEKHTYYVDAIDYNTSTNINLYKNNTTITIFNPTNVKINKYKRSFDCQYTIEVPAYGLLPQKYYTDSYTVNETSVVFTDNKGKNRSIGDCKIIENNDLGDFLSSVFYIPVIGYFF